MAFQRHDAQHCRQPGRTHRHCLTAIQALRQRHQPLGARTGILRQAAIEAFADAPAGQCHLVARIERSARRFDHFAGKIDAGNQRELADDLALAANRQRILVVERGILHPHQYLGIAERRQRQFNDTGAISLLVVADLQCLEIHRCSFLVAHTRRALT